MTWLIFKSFSKKVWLWLKEHWQLPFLLVWTMFVWLLTRRNTEAVFEVMVAKRESYKRQLEELKKSHHDEILKRDDLLKQYEKVLEEVELKFAAKKKELTEVHKNDIKEVVIKSKGNPVEIKRRIEEEFGIKYVE